MPDDLSKLSAAGDSASLPGFILSPFRIHQFGQAGQEWASRYLYAVGQAADRLTDRIADKLVSRAADDVRRGRLAYGTDDFDAACFAPEHLPFLLWLSLQPKHPQLTREQAAALLSPENERTVRRAVLEMAGYDLSLRQKPKSRDDTPIDWPGIFATLLNNKGMGPEQVSQLSMPQLINALGADQSAAEAFSPETTAQKRRAAGDRIFDDCLRKSGKSVAEFSAMPQDDLAALVKEVSPTTQIEMQPLVFARDAYVKAKDQPAAAAAA